MSANTATNGSHLSAQSSSIIPIDHNGAQDPLSEELPPAYTPMADSSHGETSVEFGPSRPFQQAPASRPAGSPFISPHSRSPHVSVWHRPAVSGWQSNWSGYPGGVQRSTTSVSSTNRPPPPRHPTQSYRSSLFPASTTGTSHPPPPTQTPSSSYAPPSAPPPTFARPTSEFARDFYTAGGDESALLGGASNQYASSSSPNLIQHRGSGEITTSQAHSNTTPPETLDDGRPTDKPVPGHPLMHNGKVLVYPAGHECSKCSNTGYRHYDPSHPCSKCWQKYSKPFSGPIAYAPWGSSDTTPGQPSRANLNLQRPLRFLSTPTGSANTTSHRQTSSLSSLSLPSGRSQQQQQLSRSATTSHQPLRVLEHPNSAYAQSNFIPVPGGGGFPIGSPDSSLYSGPSAQYAYHAAGPPPPGAVVLQPGDPRLGGQMCWRCDGTGTVSLFFFDSSRCDVCNGLGRTFR